MTRYLRWHWHRFRGWLHLALANRRFDQGDWHVDRAEFHNGAADRMLWPPPPRGPPELSNPADGDHAPAHHDGPQIR